MIFYFSGTGNSKWVAEEIAAAVGDDAVDLTETDGYTAQPGETIGLIFPVHAWGVPEVVMTFVKSLQTRAAAYCFAVCTCSREAGRTMDQLSRVYPAQGKWSLVMPSNYVPQGVDAPPVVKQKILAARKRLPELIAAIQKKISVEEVHKGKGLFLKTMLGNRGFNQFARGTAVFAATPACIGCGRCAEVCHMQLIHMTDGKPKWKYTKCSQCMACVNVCPALAIMYGGKKTDPERYWFRRDAAPYLREACQEKNTRRETSR